MNNQAMLNPVEVATSPSTVETQAQVVIKRYQNRKLYNTETSQYLTLEEISSLIKNGRDVRVIDNKTKLDITAKTLITYCCEQELKNSETEIETLYKIIKNNNGRWSEALKG